MNSFCQVIIHTSYITDLYVLDFWMPHTFDGTHFFKERSKIFANASNTTSPQKLQFQKEPNRNRLFISYQSEIIERIVSYCIAPITQLVNNSWSYFITSAIWWKIFQPVQEIHRFSSWEVISYMFIFLLNEEALVSIRLIFLKKLMLKRLSLNYYLFFFIRFTSIK